jgi:hypothetical protein
LDTNYGSVLIGNKNGTYSWTPPGFFMEVKASAINKKDN